MLEGISDMNDRWFRLREICRELTRFRRENCNHQRLHLAEQRLENETERQRNRERLQPENLTNQESRLERSKKNRSYSERGFSAINCAH
jgi:hypothetical protein